MRVTCRTLLKVGPVIFLITASTVAQSNRTPSDLFQQLTTAASSDPAADQLIQLGSSNPQARAYIAARVPALIAENPHENPDEWASAARIAGELKIAQACSALKAWVGAEGVGPDAITLSDVGRLITDPAAKALAQIGEPAVPTLAETLNSNNLRTRSDAVRALQMIGSERAIEALREHEPHETNANIKSFIDDILARKDAKK
jgi:HEAT repeat protein